MQDWITTALEILQKKKAFVLVTVIRTQGSVPREAGTKMFVTDDTVTETIGGGNFEYIVIDQCRKMLASDNDEVRLQHYPLGPLTRQCCGGRVSVSLEMLSLYDVPMLRSLRSASKQGAAITLVSELTSGKSKKSLSYEKIQGPSLRNESGEVLPSLSKNISEKTIVAFLEPLVTPLTPLYVFGAGHVGRAVVDIVSKLPFEITWADPRPDEFPKSIPHGVSKVIEGDYRDLIKAAPSNSYYLVFTHSHPLDFDLTAAILRKGDFAYAGLIGSATKKTRFKNRFQRECGLDEAAQSRLTCPIGIEGISGKEPITIAVSISAQLIQKLEGNTHAISQS